MFFNGGGKDGIDIGTMELLLMFGFLCYLAGKRADVGVGARGKVATLCDFSCCHSGGLVGRTLLGSGQNLQVLSFWQVAQKPENAVTLLAGMSAFATWLFALWQLEKQ